MPVVIRPEDFDRWLDCLNNEPRDVADAMRPVEPGFFEVIPVSDRVNKVANDDAGLLDPVPEVEAKASVRSPPLPARGQPRNRSSICSDRAVPGQSAQRPKEDFSLLRDAQISAARIAAGPMARYCSTRPLERSVSL